MKSMFTLLTIAFLSLTLTACSSSSTAQQESGSSIEGNSALSKVALEVSTIT